MDEYNLANQVGAGASASLQTPHIESIFTGLKGRVDSNGGRIHELAHRVEQVCDMLVGREATKTEGSIDVSKPPKPEGQVYQLIQSIEEEQVAIQRLDSALARLNQALSTSC